MAGMKIFYDGSLIIKAKQIIITNGIEQKSLWLLRPNWKLCEIGEFNEVLSDHPLAEDLRKVKHLRAFSLTPASLLLEKKSVFNWEPILGRVIHMLFSYEKLRRQISHLIDLN